MKQKLSA